MSDTTPEKIKCAALTLFANKGYEATTMKDISAKVGIKAPSIYAHYTSKEEILFAVMDYCFEKFTQFLKECAEKSNHLEYEQKLYKMFEVRIRFFSENHDVHKLLIRLTAFEVDSTKEILARKWAKHREVFGKYFLEIYSSLKEKNIIKNITFHEFVNSFHRLYLGYIIQVMDISRVDGKIVDEGIEDVWKLYWEGVKNK